jgi:hypothetical protein
VAGELRNVVRLPRPARTPVPESAVRRVTGRYEVDDWGRDPGMVGLLGGLADLRWAVSLGGASHLPARAGALVITNSRRFALTPLMVAWSLGEATGRPVRFVGHPDIAPTGAVLRRVGALLDDPRETRGALRDGEIVVVGCQATRHQRQAGRVPVGHIGSALATGTSVFAAGAVSSPFSRHARIEVSHAVRPTTKRRGPLAEVELAEQVCHRLQHVLDQMGGAQVLDWFGEA